MRWNPSTADWRNVKSFLPVIFLSFSLSLSLPEHISTKCIICVVGACDWILTSCPWLRVSSVSTVQVNLGIKQIQMMAFSKTISTSSSSCLRCFVSNGIAVSKDEGWGHTNTYTHTQLDSRELQSGWWGRGRGGDGGGWIGAESLRVDGDDFPAAASHHQDALDALCQHFQELHVWRVVKETILHVSHGQGNAPQKATSCPGINHHNPGQFLLNLKPRAISLKPQTQSNLS